jgi:hypothetical protein
MPPIELRQLRYFLHLADELSFSRAARKANISQSSMTDQLQRLEDVLGVRLVDRNRRNVRLTPAGKRVAAGRPGPARADRSPHREDPGSRWHFKGTIADRLLRDGAQFADAADHPEFSASLSGCRHHSARTIVQWFRTGLAARHLRLPVRAGPASPPRRSRASASAMTPCLHACLSPLRCSTALPSAPNSSGSSPSSCPRTGAASVTGSCPLSHVQTSSRGSLPACPVRQRS